MTRRKGPRNMLHLMFDPEGMRPFVDNWEEVAGSLIQRVNSEAIGRAIDEKTKELLAALLAYPDVRSGQSSGGTGSTPITPVIPISFRKNNNVLNYFSMVTTVGTLQAVAAQELRI